MKITAVIAEYNPFHNGHFKQIKKAKSETEHDAIAVVMSSSFTQRGDLCVQDRYARAQWAIAAGADIVLELPIIYSLAPAERFATGALKTLSLFGNDVTLCFGTETEELNDLAMVSEFMKSETDDYRNLLKGFLSSGQSLAKSRSLALAQINPDLNNMIQDPNNILAVEYMKAAGRLGLNFNFHSIPRIPDDGKKIASSTKIRTAMADGKSTKSLVPDFVDLSASTDVKKYNTVATYALKTKTAAELADLANISEGMENRIAKSDFSTMEEFLALTTKRYTRSTIKRIAASAVVGVTKEEVTLAQDEKPFSTVLAVKKSKKALLAQLSQADGYFYFKPSDCPNNSPVRPLIDLNEKAAKILELCR